VGWTGRVASCKWRRVRTHSGVVGLHGKQAGRHDVVRGAGFVLENPRLFSLLVPLKLLVVSRSSHCEQGVCWDILSEN